MNLAPSSGLTAPARAELKRADAQNQKKNSDLYIGEGRLILTSPDGTHYEVKVDNAGALSTSAV